MPLMRYLRPRTGITGRMGLAYMGGDGISDEKDIISTCIGVLWALGEKCQHCAEWSGD